MSGIREISERKANALNFLNPVLSTNERPQFWALNQWEASLSGPPILTQVPNSLWFHSFHHDSSFSGVIPGDCSLIVEIAVWLWKLHSDCGIAVWLWKLHSDCGIRVWLWKLQSETVLWVLATLWNVDTYRDDMKKSINWLWILQSDCGDCTMIAEIAVWLWKLQSDCGYCTMIAEIAVWLWRLQSCCGNCSLIVEIALWLSRLQSETGRWVLATFLNVDTYVYDMVKSNHWLWRLQSDCGDCSWILDIAVELLRLQYETVWKVLATLWNVDT